MIRFILLFGFTFYMATSIIAAEPINVRDYGAVGDNLTDDTAAFKKALDACGQSLGGVVSVPTGKYLIQGHLNISSFVTLEAVAFRFARTDWEMPSGCFCLGYKIGFHFIAVRHDAGNPLVVNSGPDICAVGVQVDYSQVHTVDC